MIAKSENWPAFQVERRKVSDLKPFKNNARTHSPEQVAQIAASIKEWGWTQPVLVDEAGGVLNRDAVLSGLVDSREIAARLEGETADLSGKLTADRDRKDSLSRNIAELRSSIAAIDEPALHERDTNLQRALEVLREANTTCEQHVRASADLIRGELKLAIATQEVNTANSQIAGAESDQLRDRTARAEILPLAELADGAVSFEAVHLRSLLTPNLACPVCGSTDHPHLAHSTALNELVATVRLRREEL